MKTPEPHDEIEKLLARMAPAAPAPDLMARLRAARPAEPAAIVPFPRWIPLAAAAGIAAALGIVFTQPHAVKPPAIASAKPESVPLVPLETRQHLMGVDDFGVVEDREDRPVRLIRTTWLDETIYASGTGGKRFTESRLRQEVMPVSLQTF